MPLIQATLPQPQALPVLASELALAQLARAALGLVQSAGQPVAAQVVGAMAGGLTQLQIGEMVLSLRLSAPLPAGTAVKLSIGASDKGQVGLQVTPVTTAAAASSAQAGAPAPAASPPLSQTVAAMPLAVAPERTTTGAITGATTAVISCAPMVAAKVVPAPPVTAAALPATTLDIQELAQDSLRTPTPSAGAGAVPPAPAGIGTPTASAAATGAAPVAMRDTAVPAAMSAAVPATTSPATRLDIQELAQGSLRTPTSSAGGTAMVPVPASTGTPTASAAATGAAPVAMRDTAKPAAMPATVAATTSPATALDIQESAQGSLRTPGPSAGAGVILPAPTSIGTPTASAAATGPAPVAMQDPAALAAPLAAVAAQGSAATLMEGGRQAPMADAGTQPMQRPPASAGSAPVAAASPPPGSTRAAASAPGAAPHVAMQPGSQPPAIAMALANSTLAPTPATVFATTFNPPLAPVQMEPSQVAAATVPSAGPPAGGAVAIPYRVVQPGQSQAPAPAVPLEQILADPAQAAARQNSIVPLLARLAALGPQLDALPPPAAQAVLRLLAMRLEIGGIDGKALQSAVATAGVLARTGTGAVPATPTMKSALLQLRGSLAGVPGAAIEAVTAVAGRPYPPVKGDEARTVRAELPLPMAGAEPERGLLGQTDATLSRLKLLQHASQPQEARPGAAAQQELRVEVPLLIGAETALLQLVVDREARRRDKPGERGWRMRFAFASQQTGEVGAEVALLGPAVSVSLWAESAEMEAAMAEGLDGLRAALVAEGLETGSIRMRRRAAAPSQQPGTLMDSAR